MQHRLKQNTNNFDSRKKIKKNKQVCTFLTLLQVIYTIQQALKEKALITYSSDKTITYGNFKDIRISLD